MQNLRLSLYGESFMSLIEFDSFFYRVKEGVKSNRHIVIDFQGINNISPSFMTRFISKLQEELNLKSIDIENANSRLETTFRFAMHSIKRKAELSV